MTTDRKANALTFFTFLFHDAPSTSYTSLSYSTKDAWYNQVYSLRNIDSMVKDAITAQSEVYVRVAVMEQTKKDSGRGIESDSLGSCVLWADIDAYGAKEEALKRLRAMPLPPTMIVNSGGGLHAYWKLTTFCTDLEGIKARNKKLIETLNINGVEQADSVFDLARVMRVAGTFNLKKEFPIEVTIIDYATERVYTLEQFPVAQLKDVKPIHTWEAATLDDEFLNTVQAKDIKCFQRIVTEEYAIKAGAPTRGENNRIDRSRNDQWIANRLLSLGFTAEQVIAVLTHDAWFSGAKYRETRRYDYAVTTANKAWLRREASADRFFEEKAFSAPILAEDLLEQFQYICLAGELWVYMDGVYRAVGINHARRQCIRLLGKKWNDKRAKEVLAYIQDMQTVSRDDINAHRGFVNVKNGMLDLERLELHKHDARYLSLAQLGVVYDPSADPSIVDEFVAAILPCDAIQLFWEYVASTFMQHIYFPKAFVCLVGPKDTGKSKLLAFLQAFFGKANTSAISLHTLADNRFATHALVGKLANIFADLDEGEVQSTGLLKALTGDDFISAERKYKDHFDFLNTARLFFSSNSDPLVRSPDDAYFDRAFIIPCTKVKKKGEDQDPFIFDKVTTPDALAGALLRVLEGYKRLIAQNGLSESASVAQANQTYRLGADTVTGFVLGRTTLDGVSKIPIEEWYQEYAAWCKAGNRSPFSDQRFYRRLNENAEKWGLRREYPIDRSTGKQRWCYVGRRIESTLEMLAGPFMIAKDN